MNQRAHEAHNGDVDTPTLFLLSARREGDAPGWLGGVLHQLGFLPDGSNGAAAVFPINAAVAGTHFSITGGDDALTQLQSVMARDDAAFAGLRAAPDPAAFGVIAITIVRPSPSRRAETLQRLAFMTAAIAERTGGAAMYWQPAALWSPATELAQAVIAMERHALPPVLHFIAFVGVTAAADAAGSTQISSRGLWWVNGQELDVTGPAVMPFADITRRAARLAIDAMLRGRFDVHMTIDGLDEGERIVITPESSEQVPQRVAARIEWPGQP